MKWTHRLLLRFKFYQAFVKWSKSYILPGFDPLPLYNVIAFFAHEIQESTLLNKASALAFNFMLAFFPATIFLFTLIPYIPIKNFQGQLLSILSTVLPYNAYMAFQATIEDIVKIHNGKLLSVGFLSALYFATNGISNLMQAFNRSSLIIEKRSWLKRRRIALSLTIVISIALLAAITLMTAGEAFITLLKSHIREKSHFWIYLLALSRWVFVIVIFFVTISLLYRYGPANKQKWKFLSTGSIMATILAILTSLGFTYYINNFSSYNKVYGSLGGLIILMLWLYLNSLILLIGFELNASIEYSKRNIKVIKPMFNSFRKKPSE
ncbi:YihY/virulence factor BrkB family protein [Mucilaginibacter xinganensis]|uniref:Ribonuclease BN n=1 Tax=Mucilaginibacter xinganensis TaxID=1234841 RepID=A0A223NVW5_9SPHI|nr:YihY/virulence factor BrkB family protein [Mucilaginibacter xinganensis]ASU33966.1 ribonuclease BN [Mucilaginibacter xinganensis]